MHKPIAKGYEDSTFTNNTLVNVFNEILADDRFDLSLKERQIIYSILSDLYKAAHQGICSELNNEPFKRLNILNAERHRKSIPIEVSWLVQIARDELIEIISRGDTWTCDAQAKLSKYKYAHAMAKHGKYTMELGKEW